MKDTIAVPQEGLTPGLRVAIVADYLNQRGGAEWVVAVLHTMFPGAPVFTPILDRANLWPELTDADLRVSWMRALPGLRRHFRKYFLFYPMAVEAFDLSGFDLVLSSSCAYGKAARAAPGAIHVCYCHTPARFIWDYESYVRRERLGVIFRLALPPLIRAMKRWDLRTADRPDVYVANSSVVAQRIETYYGKAAIVIPPPVSCARFSIGGPPESYYLIVSRLVSYKRIDVAVEAFNRLGLPLRIVGDGPDRAELARHAGPQISFLGHQPDKEVARMLSECRALVFPGREDFGITLLEANASGRPVIAFRGGGALDIVLDGVTGTFFDAQTPESLVEAVLVHQGRDWNPDRIRSHALQFDVPVFQARMFELLSRVTGQPMMPRSG
jgi:glycosyltransferase involved in cell wall biosynthesis